MATIADYNVTESTPNWCPGCVLGDTYIHSNPSSRPVTTIKKYDKVIGSDGRTYPVTKTYKHMHKGDVYRIVSKYFGETTLTPEHPVLAVRRKGHMTNKTFISDWIEAKDLRRHDYLVYPILKEVRNVDEIPLKFTKKKKDTRSSQLPAGIKLNDGFLRFAGYYIAEGYRNKRTIELTFNPQEQYLIDDTLQIGKEIFNLSGKTTLREEKNTVDVSFHSSYLAEIIEQWFGKGAANKKIPDFLMYLPKERQTALLRGLWFGDGWVSRKTHRASFKTISKVLCEQVKMLLLRQGILPSIHVEKAHGMHKQAYAIHITDPHDFALLRNILFPEEQVDVPRRIRNLIHDDFAYLPIREIEKKPYSGTVYNLAVDTDNTYVTDNAILHNCGDFGIWVAVKMALAQLQLEPHNVMLVSDIGCSSKMPYWVKSYGFQGLHGRAVPLATGIKFANQKLHVFIIAGDGGAYGEGGNHFIHACRRNMDLVYLVHDNSVYGLTTGQVSPTSEKGFKTKSSPEPVIEIPFNPLALAISAGATFVARGFAGDVKHLVKLIADAHQHRGFAVIDVLQPCVTYNHLNTYQYYFQRTYKLEEEKGYDVTDKAAAFAKAQEWGEKIPIGLFYKTDRPLYTDELPQIKETQLAHADRTNVDVVKFLEGFK